MKTLSTPSSKCNSHTLPWPIGLNSFKLYGMAVDSTTKYSIFNKVIKLCKETEQISRSLRSNEMLYGTGQMVPMVLRMEYELYRVFVTAIMIGKAHNTEAVRRERIDVPEEFMFFANVKSRETGLLTDRATWELNGEIVCNDLLIVCVGHPMGKHHFVLNPPAPVHLGTPARRKRMLDF